MCSTAEFNLVGGALHATRSMWNMCYTCRVLHAYTPGIADATIGGAEYVLLCDMEYVGYVVHVQDF